jgi:hypothetical protein
MTSKRKHVPRRPLYEDRRQLCTAPPQPEAANASDGCASAILSEAIRSPRRAFGALAFFAIVVAVFACGSDTTTPGVAAPQTRDAEIGPAGGSVASADGVARIDIPEGALASPVRITVARSTVAQPEDAISPVYEFGPTGTTFSTPVMISFSTTGVPPAAEGRGPNAVSRLEAGGLKHLEVGVAFDDGARIGGLTDHLSGYAIGRGAATCQCDAIVQQRCCDDAHGRFDAIGRDRDGLASACVCTLDNDWGRVWQDYECSRDAGEHYNGSATLCGEECCKHAGGMGGIGGIVTYNGPEYWICETKAPDTLLKCVAGPPKCETWKPVENPCRTGVTTSPDGGGTDAGTDGAADTGGDANACTSCDPPQASHTNVRFTVYSGPACFDANGTFDSSNGTCRLDCKCSLSGPCLTEWQGISDPQAKDDLVVECCWGDPSLWSCL